MDLFDRKGKRITIDSQVIWYDPQEEYRDLSRVYNVDEMDEEIVFISDEFSEAEVPPCELEVIC